MNVIFLSLSTLESLETQGIYGDLLKTFASHGHRVTAVFPRQKRDGLPTELSESCGVRLLKVRTGNITKTGPVEKGVSLLALQGQFTRAIDRYLPGKEADLVLFATPPTTLHGLVSAMKARSGAKSYLLLKDIFPQNSVDLGMLSRRGPKALVYAYFKRSERKTYEAADWIGCMSPANREYLLAQNPWLDPSRVEVNPNSLIPAPPAATDAVRARALLGVPDGMPLFVYGGSLGRPQGIGFLVEALAANEGRPAAFFAVAGSGTDRHLLEDFFGSGDRRFSRLLPQLPREEFDRLLSAADAGVVLLDRRFTIPNFPSRSLSYMQAGKPLVVASDTATDMGPIAEANGFGVWCESGDAGRFLDMCAGLDGGKLKEMGRRARRYFEENYTAERSYETIVRHFE